MLGQLLFIKTIISIDFYETSANQKVDQYNLGSTLRTLFKRVTVTH